MTSSGSRLTARTGWMRSSNGSLRTKWTSRGTATAIVALAALLRLYHVNTLSLWVDEGLTVAYARLSWPTVLDLNYTYDVHPPLYYVLVKAASALVPEVVAGRLVSVIAGTLTVAVLYMLVRRLAGELSALVSALILALSPLHIWYSQEARQYALTGLFVALSYLGGVAFWQTERRSWLVLYGVASLLALYTEVSAVFALLPLGILLLSAFRGRRQPTLALLATGFLILVLFMPWLGRLLPVAGITSEQGQFALSVDKVGMSLVAVAGPAGDTWYFYTAELPPWDQWPWLHGWIVFAMAVTVTMGSVALWRRSVMALMVGAALLVGTVVTAVVISQVYPSYIYRTVLYAVLGWAAISSGLACYGISRWLRLLGTAALLLLLSLSIGTLSTVYGSAFKQQFHPLADDVARAARFDWPIAAFPTVTDVLIEVYHPHLLDRWNLVVHDDGRVPALPRIGGHLSPLLWLAEIGATPAVTAQQLAQRGYTQIGSSTYTGPLYLALFAQPNVRVGRIVFVNGRFIGGETEALGWRMSSGTATFSGEPTNRSLVLANSALIDSATLTSVPAVANHVYILRVATRSALRQGELALDLVCAGASAMPLSVTTGGTSVPNDTRWHVISVAGMCPPATTRLRIELHNQGVGEVRFRDVSLRDVAPQRGG